MSKAQFSPQLLIVAVLIFAGIGLIVTENSGITGLQVHIFDVPSVSNVVLNSTLGTNTTDENLTVTWTGTNNLINITDWRLNGTSIAVLNMPFENNSLASTNVTDYSTNNNIGTISGPVWTSGGKYGGAYQYSGAGEYIDLGSFDINTSQDWSFDLWLNMTSNGFMIMNQWYNGNDPGVVWGLDGWDGSEYRFCVKDINIAWHCLEYFSVTLNEWKHFTGTYNSSIPGIELFIDGVSVATDNLGVVMNDVPATTTPWRIGTAYAASLGFSGSIDQVKIFNRTLSQEEILLLNNSNYNQIPSQELKLGDVWSAAVTPNDGTQDGSTVLSNNLTIIPAETPLACTNATNGMFVNSNTEFCSGSFAINSSFVNINASNIVIQCNGTIFDGTGGTSDGFFFLPVSNVTIVGCTFTNFMYGLHSPNPISNINVSDCTFSSISRHSIYFSPSYSGTLDLVNNALVGGSGYYSARISGSISSANIKNNNISGLGSGLTTEFGGTLSNANISNNNFAVSNGDGIYAGSLFNTVISNNIISAYGMGINVVTSASNLSILNNVMNTSASSYGVIHMPNSASSAYSGTFNLSNNNVSAFYSVLIMNGGSISSADIKNNRLSAGNDALKLYNLTNANISNNNIKAGAVGLVTTYLSNSEISNNMINASANGLNLGTFSNVSILSNSIYAGGGSYAVVFSTSNSLIPFNFINNNVSGGAGIVVFGSNLVANIINNNIRTTAMPSLYFGAPLSNSNISNNVITSSSNGFYLGSSSNNVFSGNTINSTSANIQASSSVNDTMIIGFGSNQMRFYNKSININNMNSGFFVNNSVVALNASLNSLFNTSANISIAVIGCPATIYYLNQYSTNLSTIKSSGIECNAGSDPACTNIQCSGNTVTFNVPHFDSYAAEGAEECTNATDGMNIINNTLLCPGIFNLPTGINIANQDITLRCSNTTLNGTGSDRGIETTSNNITIRGCTLQNYDIGILIDSAYSTITNNTVISSGNCIQIGGTDINHNNTVISYNNISSCSAAGIVYNYQFNNKNSNATITNNVISDIAGIGMGTLVSSTVENNVIHNTSDIGIIGCGRIVNNTISEGHQNGIDAFCDGDIIQGNNISSIVNTTNVDAALLVEGTNGIITGNTISDCEGEVPAIAIMNGASGNILSNNTFINISSANIFSGSSAGNNTLIISRGTNKLTFNDKFINVTDINNLFINNSIVAVNTTAEPNMDVEANISFAVLSCYAPLYNNSGFYTDVASAMTGATPYSDYSGLNCSDNVMNFTTNHFSTIIAAYNAPNITTIYPNATNETQTITNENNASITIQGTNQSFNVTAESVSPALTFNWFVNGIQQVLGVISDTFSSIFSFLFGTVGQYNVTVVVNDSASNDTFTWFVNVTCIEPINGMNITNSTLFCPGTYNLPNGINVNASNIILQCNQTVFNGSGVGITTGIIIDNFGNVTINNCNVTNYYVGASFSLSSNNNVLQSSFSDNAYGISMYGGEYNNISDNALFRNSIYGASLAETSRSSILSNTFNDNPTGLRLDANAFYNNIANNTMFNNPTSGFIISGSYNNFTNNNISNSSVGISSLTSYGAHNLFRENIISNCTNGVYAINSMSFNYCEFSNNLFYLDDIAIRMYAEGTYLNLYSNNTFMNTTGDIIAEKSNYGYLEVFNGVNKFRSGYINVDVEHVSNIFISNSIVAVNTTAEPVLNGYAEISLSVPSCSAGLYRASGFYRNIFDVKGIADPCTDCYSIVCSNNLTNFTTNSFSTIIATYPAMASVYPNASGVEQNLSLNERYLAIQVPADVNTTLNVTAHDFDETTLTFSWFVNGALKFVEDVFNALTSIFTSSFTYNYTVGAYNVTVVVNDSVRNDTFRFDVTACDADRDGVDSAICGGNDCNDSNIYVIGPKSNYDINRSVTICPGTFYVSGSGMSVIAPNVTVTCNNTVMIGNYLGYGFNIRNSSVTLEGCTVESFYSDIGIGLDAENVTIKNNNITMQTYSGIYILGNAAEIYNNTFFSYGYASISVMGNNTKVIDNRFLSSGGYNIYMYSSPNPVYAVSNALIANNSIISNNNTGGIFLETFDDVRIINNTIKDTYYGIYVYYSSNVDISNNIIQHADYDGIYTFGMNESFIYRNAMSGGFDDSGIWLDSYSNGNLIYENNISSGAYGILVYGNLESENIIANNTIRDFEYGIYLISALNNTFSNNKIINNTYGFTIDDDTYDNTLFNNSFTQTDIDIYAYYNNSNNLIILQGNNSMSFYNKLLNVTDIDKLHIASRIASVNSITQSQMNVSAEIVLAGLVDNSTPTIYRYVPYTTNADTAANGGVACDPLICTDVSYDNVTKILRFNVTHFSSYAVKGPSVPSEGGGRGNLPAIIPVVPPVVPPVKEEPKAPIEEVPKAIVTTTIDPNKITTNSFPCTEIGKTEISPSAAIKTLSESKYYSNIKQGYEVLVSAFNVDCKNDGFKVTLSLPDSYTNITALKCSANDCKPVDISEVRNLSCGGQLFQDVTRKELYLEPKFFPIELNRVELQPGSDTLQSTKTLIKFKGDLKGSVSLDKLFGPIQEPANPRIKIVSTPSAITFENSNQKVSANITLPYVLPEHVDESSITLFVFKNNEWKYIGGITNKKDKTVTTEIKDVSEFTENNKLTVALMGLVCLNCIESNLQKVYDGGSRDAVILVHGFENTPERFTDIINDIKLTEQPWQAWTFGYPSSKTIDDNAKDLADLLQAHTKEYDVIYIAAHSLGGLITQQAVYYASQQNKIIPKYTFVNKVKKIISVASPNKGVLTEVLSNLFNFLMNSNIAAGLFNINSAVLNELTKGKEIPQVPGIEYLVVAGTLPYDFTAEAGIKEISDGFVALTSAQDVGGQQITNYCNNFWSINTTHTDLLNNFDSRKIIERIVSKEVSSAAGKGIIGYNQYYELQTDECNSGDQYIIVGIPVNKSAQPNPGMCSCGNGVCGIDENEVLCPVDCAKIEKPKTSIWDIIAGFKPLRELIALLLFIVLAIIFVTRKHKQTIALPPRTLSNKVLSDTEKEKQLNDMIVNTRILARIGEYDRAAITYHRFSDELASSSDRIKEKFKDVANSLLNEIKKVI